MTWRRICVVLAACLLMFGAACGEESEGDTDAAGSEGATGSEECPTEETESESGLVIQELECGEGAEAETGMTVVVHYTGTLEDGTEFDSSVGGDPFPVTLGAGQVIQGWEEGLLGMKVGGTRKLTIPPELGYGPDGYPPVIPGDATLIFEVELVEIQEEDAG